MHRKHLQVGVAKTCRVTIFVFHVLCEEERVCVKRTMLCFYSQDCGAGVSSVIIRPVEGDSSLHYFP